MVPPSFCDLWDGIVPCEDMSAWWARDLRIFAFASLCSALRTPICKAKKGGFKDTFPDDLLAPVLRVRGALSHTREGRE